MAPSLPKCVDTVIIGNGPSALILSYILHGHIPYYKGGHHDAILDSKLSDRPNLLRLTPDLYGHFLSSLRYSTQALPINTLLDTLIRPNADTEINPESCIEWRYRPEKAISHVAIGESPVGGQWAERASSSVDNIGTLSYAEMLTLPGYSYAEHLQQSGREEQCDFVRPTRAEVADYLRAYPDVVGIADVIHTSVRVDNVCRTSDGFLIGSHGIRCKHLVLASGIFSINIPPPPLLAPLEPLDSTSDPLLVIGSGFSAADVIITTPPTRKVIHLFKWDPATRPSPLHGCHHTAYPEYATIYRQMKVAASSSAKTSRARSPLMRRKSNAFFNSRNWSTAYEGLANAEVLSVTPVPNSSSATVTIRLESGDMITRNVGGLKYVVGRRGSLSYLSPDLHAEVVGANTSTPNDSISQTLISGRTLRPKSETSTEVAKGIFIIGSLAGDSLIRHAVGGCVYAAGRIMGYIQSPYSPSTASTSSSLHPSRPPSTSPSSPVSASPIASASDGSSTPQLSPLPSPAASPVIPANGHVDLHLDRRKLTRAVEMAEQENRVWRESGWWGGGILVGGRKG